jgi:hypothetical protein
MASARIEEAFKHMPPATVLRGQRIVRVGKSFREPLASHLRIDDEMDEIVDQECIGLFVGRNVI